MVVGGTFDAEDCYGAWNTFKAICSQSPETDCRLVMGPWAHGAWNGGEAERLGDFDFGRKASARYYHDNFELPFFEYHLRGKGSLEDFPQTAIMLSGSNSWIYNYNPTASVKYHLDNGTLSAETPSVENICSYTSDPAAPVPYDTPSEHRRREYMIADQRFTDGRDDVVTFLSEPLTADTTFVGDIVAKLDVAITTTDADFAVRVIDLYPENDSEKPNYQMLVRGDIMRARYRHSFTIPTPMTPGEKSEVKFTMPGIAHTFKAGHRIMVCVQSSWYPLAERSPQQFVNLWHCNSSDFVKTDVKIFNSSTIEFNAL
jgi:putative CocE/NonD family hydrolase